MDFARLINIIIPWNTAEFSDLATKLKYIYVEQFQIGAILYYIGYFFDCMDGNYARTYKMTSNFGDKYDHSFSALKVLIFPSSLIILGNKTSEAKNS